MDFYEVRDFLQDGLRIETTVKNGHLIISLTLLNCEGDPTLLTESLISLSELKEE
jgi:hypothetical protein